MDTRDLEEIDDYFDERVVPLDEFRSTGVRRSNDILWSVVRMVIKPWVGEPSPRVEFLAYLSEEQMWHGFMNFDSGVMARVIYFDDIRRGTCTMCQNGNPTAHRFRFSIPKEMTAPVDVSDTRVLSYTVRGAPAEPS